jgi:uncharacterized linocin/CFP29 family protein
MAEAPSGIVAAGPAAVEAFSASRVGGFVGGGTVAQRLLQSNFNVNALRTNGVLMRDEWKHFDNRVVQITRERLVGVAELIRRGLVYNLPNALGVMTLEWERAIDDLVAAEVTMSGLNEATKDRLAYDTAAMPIPIIHKEFSYNLRHVEAARRNGRNIESTHAEVATRKVAEKIEDILFNGLVISSTVGPIYGLLTHPQRNTGAVTATWVTATGEQMVTDIIRMMDVASTKNMNGPFVLFVPLSVANRFGNDYKANSDKTILQRMMELPNLDAIVASTKLTGTNILLVQMTSDVVEMIDGIQPTMVEWDSRGGFEHNFKIIAIMLPRIRSAGDGNNGIVHYS